MHAHGPTEAPSPPWALDLQTLWRDKINGTFQKSRRRGLPEYDQLLFRLPQVAPWQTDSWAAAVHRQVLARPGQVITGADFGCGHGVALLALANLTVSLGLPCTYVGFDLGDSAPVPAPTTGARLRPMPFDRFPDSPARLAHVTRRFQAEITGSGGPQPGPLPVRFVRQNLDDAVWDLAPDSVHVAVSSTALMYVRDKLGFLEKVYRALGHGGVAVIHFDELMPPFYHLPMLRRLILPHGLDLGGLLERCRQAGVPIQAVRHDDQVFVLMQKNAARPLDFGLKLVDSAPEGLLGPGTDRPWGSRSRYAGRHEPDVEAARWPELVVHADPAPFVPPSGFDPQAHTGRLRQWLQGHRPQLTARTAGPTLQPLTSDDWTAIEAWWTTGGHTAPHRSARTAGAVIKSGGDLAAVGLWWDEQAWVMGRPAPVRIVQHVAVHPGQRHSGHRHALLTAAAAHPEAALLFWRPAHADTADSGFVPFSNGLHFRFPLPIASPWPEIADIRPYVPADRAALVALAERCRAAWTGPTVRDTAAWDAWLTATDDRRLVVHEAGGGLDGYLRLHISPDRTAAVVDEWVDESRDAFGAWIGYLAHLHGRGLTVSVETLPADQPYLAVAQGFDARSAAPDRSTHVRAGRPAAFLGALRYAEPAGAIRLGIIDPLAQWPACVSVAWAEGRLQAWQETSLPAEVVLQITALTAIALGEQSVADAVYLGTATGDPAGLGRLGRIWPETRLYRYTADHPAEPSPFD
ncbi:MAG: sterol carrier protein domain-containing protein [Candidatus Sericytochromatia bacterium]|nr:sterol carrier protein domain-containing protein [Candidatus Sericytochromatia bacterium]